MTFIANFSLTIALCNFRLVLKERAGKEIEKYLSHQDKSSYKSFQQTNFIIRCRNVEDSTPRALNKICITDLPLLPISNFPRIMWPTFLEVIESFVLLLYTSLASSRNFWYWLIASLSFTLYAKQIPAPLKETIGWNLSFNRITKDKTCLLQPPFVILYWYN